MVDFVMMKSEMVQDTLVELIHNLHCEHYEVAIDGIPVFYSADYQAAEHEYNMELA